MHAFKVDGWRNDYNVLSTFSQERLAREQEVAKTQQRKHVEEEHKKAKERYLPT